MPLSRSGGRVGAIMQTAENRDTPPKLQLVLQHYWLLALRFSNRYGIAVLTLVASAVIGWAFASSVSNYTQGGWEIHLIERGIGVNIHFHHWYYGLPLYLLAFLTIEWNATLSIFLFGLGESLAAHSFINERGIPSLIEGAPVLPMPPAVYFPIATAAALFYAFFIVRREEWLVRAREREEISTSYLFRRGEMALVKHRLTEWAGRYLGHQRERFDKATEILYGEWYAIDKEQRGEWQLHYTFSPFDPLLGLLVIRLEHIPMQGRAGQLDDWVSELDSELKTLVYPAVGGRDAAIEAFASATPLEIPVEKASQYGRE